jgi:hypothetical protein
MRCCVAESKIMARLEKVEREAGDVKRALGRITTILIDHSERIDRLGSKLDQLGDRLSERFDRLIAVTMQERTYSVERLADIERRLSRLEARFEG